MKAMVLSRTWERSMAWEKEQPVSASAIGWASAGSTLPAADVARRDISEFLDLAARIPIKPQFEEFQLQEANSALVELKERKIQGAKVLLL